MPQELPSHEFATYGVLVAMATDPAIRELGVAFAVMSPAIPVDRMTAAAFSLNAERVLPL